LRGTEAITPSRFDLLQRVNSRGTFLSSRACLPHLRKATNPHVLTLSPPLNLRPEWFGAHFAYTLSKYSMSLCTLGLSAEFKGEGIAFNSLWPRTMIATSAVEVNFGGPDALRQSRTAEIMADAAYAIVTRPARDCTGRFFIDDEVLREDGVTDLSRYAFARGEPLRTDLFIDSATLA
jgi:citronellol/citronellal dehydrogenase